MKIKFNYIIGVILLFSIFACANQNTPAVKDKPPGFVGKLFDNTVSRYNAYYNSDLVYQTSLESATEGFQEDYKELFATSVQDEIARDGAIAGEMDEIIKKTTAMIEDKPYSKWVDDHFLLNGIAHYIKGDYEMAEKIFTYVSSEYRAGVQEDRVSSREKVKGVKRAKELKEEAKEKLKETEELRKEREKEYEEKRRERESEAKLRAKTAKNIKKRNKRLKKAAEREQAERRKAGLDDNAKDIVSEIKKQEREEKKIKENISEVDKERLANAPVLEIDDTPKEGLLAHEFASKDALLWLAKTYITSEQFIAANTVLTAINEDVNFPTRLNADYYLTYADMHVRLENIPKAIEYIQLAIDSSKKKEKARLYFLKGQLHVQNNNWALAEEAFNTVEKYHPYYDMIYHAKMNNINHAFDIGKFETEDFITPLKKMTRDAKNDDFLDEVFYYLGEAYTAQGDQEKAIESFTKSLEFDSKNNSIKINSNLALAKEYYNNRAFILSEENYGNALSQMEEESIEFATTTVYSNTLSSINESLASIHLQDSLLTLSELPDDELEKFLEKKVNQEIRQQFRDKLNEANEQFGNQNNNSNNNDNRRNRRNSNEESAGFYFYDLQQSTTGYSAFKQNWSDRPNVDSWRLSNTVNNMRRRANSRNIDDFEVEEVTSKEELLIKYIAEIPRTEEQINFSKETILSSYINIINQFSTKFGDDEMTTFYQEELDKRNLGNSITIGNAQSSGVSVSNTPNTLTSPEVDQLYNQVYDAYQLGKYEQAISLAKKSENFQNNNLADKFAFIKLMSEAKFETNTRKLEEALVKFTINYPNSILLPQVDELLIKLK